MAENTFLFVATFEDGTQIFQNPEDRSAHVEGKNCFFDVLQYAEKSPLICFVLGSVEANWAVTFGVDLRDGHFEVNGIPFFQHRHDRETLEGFRLIYFRNNRIELSGDGISDHSVGYTLGWQTTGLDGGNVQKIIKI